MSSTRNRDLIVRIEETDSAFTVLWSNLINLQCGRFFVNEELPNDIFFNKLTDLTCISDQTIDGAVTLARRYHTIPYVYALNNQKLEEKLVAKNFHLRDTQHVLTKNPDMTLNSSAYMISNNESMLWSTIFCQAYDCHDWITSVDKIVRQSIGPIEYYIDKSASSCVALYENNSILGLYCLGTMPDMRRKGLAASLIGFALNEVKRRNLELLMLETYGLDGLLDFYLKLGFKEEYKKNIYTI